MELSRSLKLSPPSFSLSLSKASSFETFNVTKPIPFKQDKTCPVQRDKTKGLETNYSRPTKRQQDHLLLMELSRSLKHRSPSLSLSLSKAPSSETFNSNAVKYI